MVTVEMENVGHLDSAGDELHAGGLEVGDDEEHALSGARNGRWGEMDRAWRAGRRQLHGSKVFPNPEIGVERPAQPFVEGLGAIDVGYGNGDDLELQIDHPGVQDSRCVVIDRWCAAHKTSMTGKNAL